MNEPAAPSHARPLEGKRVLVTRPVHQAGATVELLERHGAVPISLPTIAIEPTLDEPSVVRAVHELARGHYDLAVFTSDNGVRCFFDALGAAGKGAAVFSGVRVAAIGPATAAALHERGIATDVVAATFVAEGLAEAVLALDPKPKTVLLPTASVVRETLPDTLRSAGVEVDAVPVYRTVRASSERRDELAALLPTVDVVLLTSSSTVDHLCALLGDGATALLAKVTLASIGPITTATAEKHGLSVAVTAPVSTTKGLVAALEVAFAARD